MNCKAPEQISADRRAKALRLPTNRKPPARKTHIVIEPAIGTVIPYHKWSISR